MPLQSDSLTPMQAEILQALQEAGPVGTMLPQLLNHLRTIFSGLPSEQLLAEVGGDLVLLYNRGLINLTHPGLRWHSPNEPREPLFIATYEQEVIWDPVQERWAMPNVREYRSWWVTPKYSIKDVDNLATEGYAALAAGFPDKARTFWRRALLLDPDHEQSLLGLASISRTIAEQRAFLQHVLRVNPLNSTAQQQLARLPKDLES